MHPLSKTAASVIFAAICIFSLVACGGQASTAPGGNTQTIVIGTTLPLTGSLSIFGANQQTGYQRAVNEINTSGGISIQGTKHQVKLVVLDDQSDPNLASQQARTLLLKDNAVALLGSATPPLSIPVSNVADQLQRPVVLTNTPIEAWLAAHQGSWTYAWDTFFDENQMTQLQFQTANLVKTDKRVALFTDTEEDGVTMGALWEKQAPTFGYQVAYHAKFPVGTTNFSSQVAAAQAAKADILIAQMVPPDAAGLWKQMKSVGYQPKLAFCEKCGNGGAWKQLLGPVAEGTLVSDWWSPTLDLPQTNAFVSAYGKNGINSDLSLIVASYSVSSVLLDAIAQAQSLDPNAINTAIGKTDKTYPVGHIQFGANHASAIPAGMDQWQGNNSVRVYPVSKGTPKIETPIPGLG
jgi:branched-chain amino acid transport system substrate-binding protein